MSGQTVSIFVEAGNKQEDVLDLCGKCLFWEFDVRSFTETQTLRLRNYIKKYSSEAEQISKICNHFWFKDTYPLFDIM
jgi:hypothetical protein